jgi:CBS domain-containing protein
MKTCRDVMTRNPVSCPSNTSAQDAAKIMKSEDVGSVPVVDDSKRLVGIVTDRDLALNVVAEGRDTRGTKVQEVMTRNPITCRPDDDLDRTLSLMAEHQIRRIPVVDENQHIVGIIAQADVALRANNERKTAEVVEEISKPTV